jgi:hypothetical protein
MARTASATPTPIPASAPGERELELEFWVTASPVPVGEAELLDDVTGLGVSDPDAELEVVVVPEEVDFVLDEDVVEDEVVEEEDEPPWMRLHLTVED